MSASSVHSDISVTARVIFGRELLQGALGEQELEDWLNTDNTLRSAVGPRLPGRLSRMRKRWEYRAGAVDYLSGVAQQINQARRSLFSVSTGGRPRFLIRVDEFPNYRAWNPDSAGGSQDFARFHEILADHDVSYLLAVLPRVSDDPLSPSSHESRELVDDERELLRRVLAEGAVPALHGLNHRSRSRSPRRRSELCGLSKESTERMIREGIGILSELGITPDAFIAPYNRFEIGQMEALAKHFDLVCGGPESIPLIGWHVAPRGFGDTVYLPSYAPFYGSAGEVLAAADLAIAEGLEQWIPIVLHWEWELRSDWSDLKRLLERIAPYSADWSEFLKICSRALELRRGLPLGSREADATAGDAVRADGRAGSRALEVRVGEAPRGYQNA